MNGEVDIVLKPTKKLAAHWQSIDYPHLEGEPISEPMAQPFLSLAKSEISEEAIEAVAKVLRSGWLTSGPCVHAFESQLSQYFSNRPVRTFASGTSSLEIGLRVAGVGSGDEVITTPLSWIATANVILSVGANPVFVDVEQYSKNMDLDLVEAAITPRTKAIVPVYLAGRPLDTDRLYDIAEKYKLRVVEDAAQAIGSTWKGRRIGSFGDMASFSFQATKNITTGEGGCLVFRDERDAKLAEKLRLQGLVRGKYDAMEADILGGKHNMTEMAAAIGSVQLRGVEIVNEKRRKLFAMYRKEFGPKFQEKWQVQLPSPNTGSGLSNCHLFQLVLPNGMSRTRFQQHLHVEYGIGTGTHYPPIHLFKLYRERGFTDNMYPMAEFIGRHIVTLPLFNSMTEQDVQRVVSAVKLTLEHLVKKPLQ